MGGASRLRRMEAYIEAFAELAETVMMPPVAMRQVFDAWGLVIDSEETCVRVGWYYWDGDVQKHVIAVDHGIIFEPEGFFDDEELVQQSAEIFGISPKEAARRLIDVELIEPGGSWDAPEIKIDAESDAGKVLALLDAIGCEHDQPAYLTAVERQSMWHSDLCRQGSGKHPYGVTVGTDTYVFCQDGKFIGVRSKDDGCYAWHVSKHCA